jgi:two-component system, sensor histidine kinase RegB
MEREISPRWFVGFRWLAFAGQLLVLGIAVIAFKLTLPWMEIAALLLLIPASNLLFHTRTAKRFSETQVIGGLLVLDTLLLTGVLHQAGGPTNPFTIVYLLHVVLAAVMLGTSWTWAIAVLSSCGFGALFVGSRAVPEWDSHGAHHGFSLHLHGMLIAYIIVALLAAYFLNRIVGDLRKKERAFERLKNTAINQQKLASLTTIVGGAAHELGTPLATIAVVTHELERSIKHRYSDPDLLDDVALLNQETARCKKVLQDLSERTGDLLGEAPQAVTVSDLLQDAIEPLRLKLPFSVHGKVDSLIPRVPRKSLTLAIRALVKNAFEASQSTGKPVEILATESGQRMILEIQDSGTGMDAETLERVGEPFFSSKQPGHGMGLGVYLSRLTVEQLGGSLTINSQPGRGTKVKLMFPVDCSVVTEAA